MKNYTTEQGERGYVAEIMERIGIIHKENITEDGYMSFSCESDYKEYYEEWCSNK